MSKTIVIMDAPDNASGIAQIGDENPYFLGAFGEVITVLRHNFPNADFSDPTNIKVETDKGRISIEIAKHTPVSSFSMVLDKDEALELVLKICEKANWRALDTDTGMFIDNKIRSTSSKSSSQSKSWWKLWKR